MTDKQTFESFRPLWQHMEIEPMQLNCPRWDWVPVGLALLIAVLVVTGALAR